MKRQLPFLQFLSACIPPPVGSFAALDKLGMCIQDEGSLCGTHPCELGDPAVLVDCADVHRGRKRLGQ